MSRFEGALVATQISAVAVAALVACSSGDQSATTAPFVLGAAGDESDARNLGEKHPPKGTGGSSETGGTSSTGGSPTTGGSSTSGGSSSAGGTGSGSTGGSATTTGGTGSGGTGAASTGGSSNTGSGGDAPSTGGMSTGGSSNTGGSGNGPSTGGMSTMGGSSNTGGTGNATSTGGMTSAGGTSSTGGTGGTSTTGGTSGSSGRGGTGGTTGGAGGTSGTAGTGGTATKSPACGSGNPQKGDFHLSTTDGSGKTRDYEVIVPSSYSNNTPLALTVVYHGAGGTEADAKAFGLQNASGAAAASIFVFPQGIDFQTYGVGWDDTCSGRDMALFDHMTQTLGSTYCIDLSKVFVAGFSWGCDHVTSLACCRGTKITAIAAASCSDEFGNAADYKTYDNLPCPGATKVGVRFTHDANGDGPYSAQQFATTSALFRSFDGCSSSATTSGACSSFQGCAKPVLDCAYSGLGHTIPSTWAADTWGFFKGF